jgi:ATP-dependent Clp protease ATP-binding subunit ClpC
VLEHGWVLQVTDAAREWLAENGYDPKFGARPLRRLIQEKVEDQLSEEHLKGRFSAGDVVEVGVEDDEITIETPKPSAVSAD